MKSKRIYRAADEKTIADPCWMADGFFDRLKGLMGRAGLEQGSGMLIRPCNSIHTFFMRFAIDVVYLDPEFKIVKLRRAMSPWRLDFPVSKAAMVLELPVDGASGLREGDLLCLS